MKTQKCLMGLSCILMVCFLPLSAFSADILSTAPLGWLDIANTKIRPNCPVGNFGDCSGVTEAWNSAVFDTKRNRLIVWGGGHTDYYGNEIYSLNLSSNPITMTRINDPSLNETTSDTGATNDNPPQAVTRHTYDHIVYMSHIDSMFVFGGARYSLGFMLQDTWTFDFTTLKWNRKNPSGTLPEAQYGRVTAYNPITQKTYIHDQYNLYSYTYETDSYAILSNDPPLGQDRTGTFDSKRQLFISVGNGEITAYDVSAGSKYLKQTWATTGGASILNAPCPGLAYDPVSDRIVAWSGGNTVYLLDPAATNKVWTPVTYPGGPGAAIVAGTFKRFSYSPSSNAFVVVNSVDKDAFAFKLTPGAGTGTGTGGGSSALSAPKNLRIQ